MYYCRIIIGFSDEVKSERYRKVCRYLVEFVDGAAGWAGTTRPVQGLTVFVELKKG